MNRIAFGAWVVIGVWFVVYGLLQAAGIDDNVAVMGGFAAEALAFKGWFQPRLDAWVNAEE